MSTIDAYPLTWPIHWPRTSRPERSRFAAISISAAEYDIRHELRLLGVEEVIISSNLGRLKSGVISSRQRLPEDPGVCVYFTRNGKEQAIPCDKWDRVQDNMRAIAKTIDALRGLERWGTHQIVDAAFAGFAALPGGDRWWEVLHVDPDAPREAIVREYRRLVKQHHPDAGGDPEQFHRIQQAYDQAVAS